MTTTHSFLLTKVDIVYDGVTYIDEYYNSMLPKIDEKAEVDLKNFGKIHSLLVELKEMVLKSSSPSLFTTEFLTQKFHLLESTIHSKLAPMPHQLLQGCKGEKEK
ncbi:unnamed protein product [Lactuca saligna]|uniref:Uncharacterized protein n=1 Tax=Lactuca saligna TaxID=75948 RepID=A0AA36DY28_LACSI|nr:unnamed protein product [Lactuca saligna]